MEHVGPKPEVEPTEEEKKAAQRDPLEIILSSRSER